MSSIIRRMAKAKKTERKPVKRTYRQPPKEYTSFNIFTRDGQNLTVTSKKPMTLIEAQFYYKALSISGND